MDVFEPFQETPLRRSVLVSDFDGTLAHPDFYQLVIRSLVPKDTPDYWQAYRTGDITHFEALRRYFAAAEGGEGAFLKLLEEVSLPRNLPELIRRLADKEWSVIIVSAGCQWYIDRLLQRAGVELPVVTNRGRIENGRLLMHSPETSAFFSEEDGIDKAAVVRSLLAAGKSVAYCGDGFTDYPAARLVSDKHRFARADLAAACQQAGIAFRPFEAWETVVNALVDTQTESM